MPQDERERERLTIALATPRPLRTTEDQYAIEDAAEAHLARPEKRTTPLEAVSKAALLGLMDEWCPNCWYSFSMTANGATVSRTKPCPKHAAPAPKEEKKRASLGNVATLLEELQWLVVKYPIEMYASAQACREAAAVLRACEEFKKEWGKGSGEAASALYRTLP